MQIIGTIQRAQANADTLSAWLRVRVYAQREHPEPGVETTVSGEGINVLTVTLPLYGLVGIASLYGGQSGWLDRARNEPLELTLDARHNVVGFNLNTSL